MTSDVYVPTREDKFSFGIWTVGWQGVDVFGGPVRPAMPAARAVRKLAELGAYGVNFHDNDVFDFDATPPERDERVAAFRKALDETGLVVPTVTTNLLGPPMFRASPPCPRRCLCPGPGRLERTGGCRGVRSACLD